MALAKDATPVSLRAAIRHEEILYALEVKGRVSTSDLETRLGSFKVYFDYHWSPSTTVRFGYWHESFRSSDWQLDGVSPATLPNLLSLGARSQRYNQDVLWGSVSFAFGGGRVAP